MDNILSELKFDLDDFNPKALAEKIAGNLKTRRLELNITQEELARKSGVSLGSVKRFECKAEVSLKHLLMLAIALNATEEFTMLFSKKQYKSLDELISDTKVKSRKRARKND